MKKIPTALAKQYIAVEAELHELQGTRDALKSRLDVLVKKGYTSPLLDIIEGSRASIPWKELCEGLVSRYKTALEARIWYRNVARMYPPKPIAPTIRAAKSSVEEAA